MCGVGIFDKGIKTNAYTHRFQKWWKYILVYLLEIAINNLYFVFLERRKGEDKLTYLGYEHYLI